MTTALEKRNKERAESRHNCLLCAYEKRQTPRCTVDEQQTLTCTNKSSERCKKDQHKLSSGTQN